MTTIPCPFPLFDYELSTLHDGIEVPVPKFCRNKIDDADTKCTGHYRALIDAGDGFYSCPYGFTTRKFEFEHKPFVVSAVIGFPRFDTPDERRMAKQFPANKTSRASINTAIAFLKAVESLRADVIQESSKVLPHAFHELRKLNGAVLQHAEREIASNGETRNLLSIKAAAELMRNNFDILEALSNTEGIKQLPLDSTINLFDLVFKMKRVYQEKAVEKSMSIHVNGDRPIISGSQKSFPIVPAVLLENAIKYGRPNTHIYANLTGTNGFARLVVENRTDEAINATTCFERGVRFSSGVEGGGFGLFLAREVVRCHRGTIRCEASGDTILMVVEFPLRATIPHTT